MNRRTYLGIIAGAVTGVAGCSSGGEPKTETDDSTSATESPPQTTATETNGSTSAAESPPQTTATPASEYHTRFVAYLDETKVDVRAVEADPPASTVSLRYATEKTTAEDLGAEIGSISGGFYREVRAGWEMEQLNATVLGRDGTQLATWFARSAWFFEFQDGERTAEELSLRILKTVEPVE